MGERIKRFAAAAGLAVTLNSEGNFARAEEPEKQSQSRGVDRESSKEKKDGATILAELETIDAKQADRLINRIEFNSTEVAADQKNVRQILEKYTQWKDYPEADAMLRVIANIDTSLLPLPVLRRFVLEHKELAQRYKNIHEKVHAERDDLVAMLPSYDIKRLDNSTAQEIEAGLAGLKKQIPFVSELSHPGDTLAIAQNLASLYQDRAKQKIDALAFNLQSLDPLVVEEERMRKFSAEPHDYTDQYKATVESKEVEQMLKTDYVGQNSRDVDTLLAQRGGTALMRIGQLLEKKPIDEAAIKDVIEYILRTEEISKACVERKDITVSPKAIFLLTADLKNAGRFLDIVITSTPKTPKEKRELLDEAHWTHADSIGARVR